MENNNKQPEKKESSVQWHTLSENLMDLSTENKEPRRESHDSPFHQGRIQPQNENNTTSPPAPTPRPEPVEIPQMPSGPKKKPVWGIVAVAAVLVLAIGAGLFYFTVHLWTEPTCTEASVCKICGKTGSPAAGHSWTPASCTAPKTCSVCHETKGSPLGHDLEDEVSYDFIKCTKETRKACSRCEYNTSSKSEQLTSFLDEQGEYFLMSPNAFKKRLEYLASKFNPKDVLYDSVTLDDMKDVSFRWVDDNTSGAQGSSSTGWPILECYSGSEELLTIWLYDLSVENTAEVDRNLPSFFNCVVMSGSGNSKKAAAVYYSMEFILVTACDPTVSSSSLTAVLLAAEANSGGGTENNNLVYGASNIDYNIVTRRMVEKVLEQRS